MQTDRCVLLSVRPRFASALLEGSKTVEVRRRRARIDDGTVCLLYASSPASALVGAIRIKTIEAADSDALWIRHREAMGLSRDEYEEYLAGASQPCAIVVAAASAFARPVPLLELRLRHSGFVAPQSYRFLQSRELKILLNGQLGQLEQLASPDHRLGLRQVFGPSDRRGPDDRRHASRGYDLGRRLQPTAPALRGEVG
jgi:predicted transcriptional regulator